MDFFQHSFWPAAFAFAGVTIAAYTLIEFGLFIASRYRERYLEEAKTELDDVLIQMPANRVLDISIAVSVLGAVITLVITAVQMDEFAWHWGILFAVAAGSVLFPVPRIVLKTLKKKRLQKFNLQLEDALGMMSSALKAGFSIHQALDEIANCDMHPVGIEFRLLTNELRLGVPLEQALENMNRRVESDDFELVVTAIITARQTGGELSSALERVAGLIRERVRIARKVHSLTAMGRLQAIMIGAMPFLLLFGLSHIAPQMMQIFFNSAVGIIAIVAVFVLVICGFLAIKKITTIEV
ncbi:MAG: type II secretion system F family protein [Lentisphaeria bacterium]|nr:type II secretion system F family protein [Lentisphaeria bacterium]MBQ7396778.1 type II secretion system F family protein [Lentisphaeria bacterium]